jgi:type VI secretion system secreted protein VgrG
MVGLASILALIGNRPVFTFTVEGVDTSLRVLRFSGQEGVSTLYEFRVELACEHMVEVQELVGRRALLCIEGIEEPRLVHGIVSQAEYVGETRNFALFEVTLVPRVWRTRLRQDCRIFQEMRTPDIVRGVLEVAGFRPEAYRFDLVRSYAPRNYCVQYRESDWDFISRLLEEDGIFYYFEHAEDRHVLVMADHEGTHRPIAGQPELWWNPQGGNVEDREHIHEFRFGEQIRSGKATLRDFYFPQPDQSTEIHAQASKDADLEVYDYPGEYRIARGAEPDRGEGIVKNRLEELQATRRSGAGKGDCMRLAAGFTFSLVGHPRDEINREYTLLTVRLRGNQPQVLDHDAVGGFMFESRFTCIEREVPYRPPRVTPRPFVRGLQSAVVVGPPGEEVHVDDQGRVMVQFHWDRQGQFDDHSSCWIRVSQLWAGAGWGAMFIPRIGHEVLVDFIEGDPDRPIVTGRVYHGENATPYPLPDEKTKSTVKSESSPGGGGFNELRFEDRKGAEEVFFHAQRDLNEVVLNNNSRAVTVDQTFTVGGDQTFTITGNRSVTVTEGDESLTVRTGQSTTTIKQDRSVTVQSGDSSLTVESGTHTMTVKRAITATSQTENIGLTAKTGISLTAETADLTATAQAAVAIAAKTKTLTLSALKDAALASLTGKLGLSGKKEVSLVSATSTLTMGSKEKATLASSEAVNIAAVETVAIGSETVDVQGKKIVLTGAEEITLQVGPSSITIKKDGVTISGPTITSSGTKISSSATGMHTISGALIKIN